MSDIIRINDGSKTSFISFGEFCSLSESFKPKETPYGTDGKDGQWNENKTHYWTLFSHSPDHHVMVHLSKNGEFGFGTHRGEFTTDVVNHYDESPKHAGEALSVMNKAMHVGIEGAKKHEVNHVFFKGANDHLKSVYSKAVKSKFLQKHLKDNGFIYGGEFRGEHHFTKY